MGKNKKKTMDDKRLTIIIYQSIFDIVNDETHHPSYRKYLDKVLNDIFGYDGFITTLLMSTDHFKYIKDLLDEDEYKTFCQMMLHQEDAKTIKDLVRVAYDAAQIANKPKKRISSKDIKSYRYLVKLYAQGIKALRKKYKVNDISKKDFKSKYSDLNRMLGKNTSSYKFDLGSYDEDDDENLSDIYEDEDEDNDSQFDAAEYDLENLPTQFSISHDDEWSPPPKKSTLIIDGDETNLQLYDDSDEAEEEDPEDKPIMSEGKFQRYSMSIFEKLLKHLDSDKPSQNDGIEDKFTLATPIPDISVSVNSSEDQDNEPVYIPETVIEDTSTNQISAECPHENEVITVTNIEESKEKSDAPKKSYKNMTRKEIIDTFNSNNGVVNTASTEGEAEQ